MFYHIKEKQAMDLSSMLSKNCQHYGTVRNGSSYIREFWKILFIILSTVRVGDVKSQDI
jgi:hypothetical protein